MRRRLANIIDSLHLDVLIYDENNEFLIANKRMREKIAEGLHQPGADDTRHPARRPLPGSLPIYGQSSHRCAL